MRAFVPGDVVVMLGSSILMTVREYGMATGKEAFQQTVICNWFDVGSILQDGEFIPAQLRLISAAPPQI